jgi:Transposase IS66 family
VAGDGAWLWAATSKEATAYHVAEGRSFDDATVLVSADYDGTLVRDGWAPYRRYETATHQTCVAHYADVRIMPISVADPGRWADLGLVGSA